MNDDCFDRSANLPDSLEQIFSNLLVEILISKEFGMIISRISMESLAYRTIHETLNRIFGSRTRDPSECETYAEYLS